MKHDNDLRRPPILLDTLFYFSGFANMEKALSKSDKTSVKQRGEQENMR